MNIPLQLERFFLHSDRLLSFQQAFINVLAYPEDSIYVQILNASMNISEILWNNDRDAMGIEYERHDENYCNFTRTQGIGIFCPGCTSEFQTFRSEYEESTLDEETNWSHVLECLLEARGV